MGWSAAARWWGIREAACLIAGSWLHAIVYAMGYLEMALHHGNPALLAAIVVLLAGLAWSQTVAGSGIAEHPYSSPEFGGALGSDLPTEAIGRAELEALLVRRRRRASRRP
jgi:hypothetical protein